MSGDEMSVNQNRTFELVNGSRNTLTQWFSTGVPRHPRVPFAIRWGAASYCTLSICLEKRLNAVMLF